MQITEKSPIKYAYLCMQCEMTKIQEKMAVAYGRATNSDGNYNFWSIEINVKSKPETPSRNRNGLSANNLLPVA